MVSEYQTCGSLVGSYWCVFEGKIYFVSHVFIRYIWMHNNVARRALSQLEFAGGKSCLRVRTSAGTSTYGMLAFEHPALFLLVGHVTLPSTEGDGLLSDWRKDLRKLLFSERLNFLDRSIVINREP